MKTALKLSLIVFAFAICQVGATEKYDLRLKLNKGDKYKMVMVQDQSISQKMGNMNMDMKQYQEMIMFSEVNDVDSEGVMTIVTTYGDIKMEMDTPAGKITMDTANPDPNIAMNPQLAPIADIFGAMKDAKIITKVNSLGKTVSIEGMDEMMDEMFQKLLKDDPNAAKAMKQMMKSFVSEDRIEEMSNGMYVNFPDGMVAVGDVWDTILSMGAENFPIELDTTCVLTDVNDGIANIQLISKMDMGADEGMVIENNGMKMNMLMTGVMNGNQLVDIETGWMKESQTEHSFTGTMKMEPNPQMPNGMSVPMSIKGKTTITSKKI